MRTIVLCVALSSTFSAVAASITFHKDFEGGSFGRLEQVSSNHFRCHVEGQADERGRNRQATWYFFRMDGWRGLELKLSLTNLVGEYNNRPGAVSMNADTVPVFSHDGEKWQHFRAMDWDPLAKEATVPVRFERESLWVAHVPPYTVSRLQGLLSELKRSASVRLETIGRTMENRELPLVTVTDFEERETDKKTVWLIARQHAWEAGTSFVMEGALRFIASDEPAARDLRQRVMFKFVPMMAHDGVVHGKVRFNMSGYDLNRHWNNQGWRSEDFEEHMPEIAFVKKAIFAWLDTGKRIDLMVNLHNTETAEYVRSQTDDPGTQALFKRFEDELVAKTSFDPSTRVSFSTEQIDDTNSLWRQGRVPVALMEQRISVSRKLGRRPTVEDRLKFGRDLVAEMGNAVLR